jgi:adenylate cyclase
MNLSAAQIFSTQPPRKHAISSAFEDQFGQEILKSDKLRVTILIGAICSFCLALLLLSLFGLQQFQETFHGRYPRFLLTFLTFFAIALACLLIERHLIVHRLEERGKASPLLQYLSAFIETSLPSIGVIVGIQFLGPIYALFTPAPFVYPLFIVLSALRLNSRLCVFTGAVAGIEYSIISLYLIQTSGITSLEPILIATPQHLFKGFLLFATGCVTGLVTLQIKKRIVSSFETMDEKNRISRTFGEYVSPAVMDKLLTLKPDLRSEKRNVCVMFLDIRNFTSFAETRAPEEVVRYLESLFEFMIEIVNKHHGVINKFLGDGFMAVFGAPLSEGSDCLNGVTAAREILMRVNEEVSNGKVLPTRVGIGLHAGEAVTGSIGSSLRREYTVIGDVVNLAARIEKLNKQFSSQLLISEIVWQALGNEATAAVPMGQVQVTGRQAPIQIYQVA